ncbi:hypothetical protein [Limobrevibacterium gyesilva]|uniref:Uncharacterized protein n=1 Tax=Limobrevibacterium gyesilva TaxID=2991712 RepID=A0AA41YSJ2_9PROT|nr:hypothetical protein [Limobrevibacterium gyesilva]MCW3475720.1 hypothetical protein [Limobrevibacterium gyesilva]
MDQPHDTAPDRCLLQHHVFMAMGEVTFRRASTDGTPVMVVLLGEREASVPLRALQREFAIDDDSPDGRMLGLIAESLDYVTGLHLGDKLPSEVLTGKASWEPDARHRRLVASRLRLQLVAWLDPQALEAGADAAALQRLDEDPAMRQQVQAAFAQAARSLDLPSPEDVVRLVEALADELSYIEALRDGLYRRVQIVAARLERLGRGWRGDMPRLETLTQVQRLTAIGLKQIGGRFDEVDAQTGEVLAALRNAESQQAFIRSNRDWLYRCQRAWSPILKEWDFAPTVMDELAWGLIGRTYQFLAPRYMPVTEWQAFNSLRQSRAARRANRVMAW